jgi:hypothetical protein
VLTHPPLAFGLGEGADDLGKGGEVDAAAGLDGLNAGLAQNRLSLYEILSRKSK